MSYVAIWLQACLQDVHIFKHCHEMTRVLLWIGIYCISCVVQQTSGVNDLSSSVRYGDSCLAAIRHVQSNIPVVRPRPNIRSHSVLLFWLSRGLNRLTRVTRQIRGDSKLRDQPIALLPPRVVRNMKNSYEIMH